jgi:hypothetical protein
MFAVRYEISVPARRVRPDGECVIRSRLFHAFGVDLDGGLREQSLRPGPPAAGTAADVRRFVQDVIREL